MRIAHIFLAIVVVSLSLTTTSCRRSSDQVWDDGRSAGRHMSRGFRSLGGKHGDSRAIQSRDQFMPYGDGVYYQDDNNMAYGTTDQGFVPLSDQYSDDQVAMADFVAPQPRETPGDPGSSIPGISSFRDPSSNAQWSSVFKNITFEYNSNLVKGQENINTLHNVANYMRNNNGVYVFVEGHCDERGPEAYNLSLGSRRSNAIRNQLIQEGVNPDNIFTISYGKDRPLFMGHNEGDWEQNRRAEFKIYQR